MVARMLIVLVLTATWVEPAPAQFYQSDFPPEEFQARWAKLFDAIGSDGVAVVQGMPMTEGFSYPRQYNTMYYLSGVETPGAYLLLDGRTRKATLYLPRRDERLARTEGLELSADDADLSRRLIGVDAGEPVEAMRAQNWPLGEPLGGRRGGPTPVIYAEFSPAEGAQQSRYELIAAEAARAMDSWDGGLSRQRRFAALLRARQPRAEIRDLNPILDEMRTIKSPREIELLRRAAEMTGLGLMEAMRSTELGVYEYQLDAAARYVFLLHGARLEAYRSITASGTENINRAHYFRNTEQLKDGDLVLMDYAPDYRYYVADVGRVWPVNGRYGSLQRELLQFVLEYHKAVLSRIRPSVTPEQIMNEAAEAMKAVFARTRFSKPIYEQAARRLVETGGGVFSHTVGMAVHDVGRYRGAPLEPGLVFSVDPQLWVPEENLYLRYEDTVVVTEDGVENFTAFLPMELDDLERLVRQTGVVQKVPTVPISEIRADGSRQ